MTGVSEILVLMLLITCILILPRMFKGKPVKRTSPVNKLKRLPVKIRFTIVLSILYPIAMALYLKPWHGFPISYISYGIIPVFLIWGILWILAGRKK